MQTSARNTLQGRVTSIEPGSVNAVVTLEIGSGQRIVASITRDSVERLGLAEGMEATMLVKATSVIVTTATDNPTSARNFVPGTVHAVDRGAVNSVVTLDVADDERLVATVTNESVDRLGLEVGVTAAGLFKASSVILATGG